MGKKMKLPFISKSSKTIPSWPWPSCGNPKTISFRSIDDMVKTVNPTYIAQYNGSTSGYRSRVRATSSNLDGRLRGNVCDGTKHLGQIPESDSIWLEGEAEEVIIGLRSEARLFFDPLVTHSILNEAKHSGSPFEESLVMVLDSSDPYVDFKKSMEEMVEAHGLSWENLEKLLNWYLRVNEKINHGYVIGAFVDLLVGLNFSSLSLGCSKDENGESSSSNYIQDSLSSSLSFSFSTISTSPCLSSPELVENDVEKEVDNSS